MKKGQSMPSLRNWKVDGLPNGYWGPNGRPVSNDFTAQPNERLDISDYPANPPSPTNDAPNARTHTPVRHHSRQLSSESTVQSSRSERHFSDVSDNPAEPPSPTSVAPNVRTNAPVRQHSRGLSSETTVQSSRKCSVRAKFLVDGLPNGYWGPNGRPVSNDFTAQPNERLDISDYPANPPSPTNDAPNARTHTPVRQYSRQLSSESTVQSSRSERHFSDVSDNPAEPPSPTSVAPNVRTNAPVRQHSRGLSSETTVQSSRKCSVRAKYGPRYDVDINSEKANNRLWDVFKKKVILKMDDITQNKSILNRLKVFRQEVAKVDPKFPLRQTDKSLIPTGSYYEKLKVSRPNEFDVMLELDVKPRAFKLEYERGPSMEGYVKLKKVSTTQEWSAFMTDDGNYLSPIKIRKHFFALMKQVIILESKRDVKVEEHGPAVQLTFTSEAGEIIAEVDAVLCVPFPGEWPAHAIVEKRGLPSSLVQDMREKGFHVVPKTFESGIVTHSEVHWRVSFSVCEKHLTLHKIPCARKDVLRLVKYLREKHESRLPGINSFQLKNIFLQQALIDKKLSQWDKSNFMARVIDILNALLLALKEKKLCHFFNSRCNLMLGLDNGDSDTSIDTIEWMLTLLLSNDEEKIKEML